MASKAIVFCADGTWCGPDQVIGNNVDDEPQASSIRTSEGDDHTNVYKLFCNLAGELAAGSNAQAKEQEKFAQDANHQVTQAAKYVHGVGDSSNLLTKAMGGVLGAGVIARIVRGHTFISRHYQPGDRIYIVGFSRGAYTARALAGMIGRVGLLDATKYDVNDKEAAYRRSLAAWQMSRSKQFTGSNVAVRWLNRGVDWLTGAFNHSPLPKTELIANVPIRAVGVWDTVGSMGIPLYLRDGRVDLFRFVDLQLSNKVLQGFHAMAIDERRGDFPVTRWESRVGVEQVWFMGAHGDVGGGYAMTESRLSDVAFEWMMNRLSNAGLSFLPEPPCKPDCQCSNATPHAPWEKLPYKLMLKQPRQPVPSDAFHPTVIERWQQGSYRPDALSWVTPANVSKLTIVS